MFPAAQYRPEYQVGEIASDGSRRHAEIDRAPREAELALAFEHARAAGLWRFDERRA